jgi:predicted DNA-binding protein (UPF0251 family)
MVPVAVSKSILYSPAFQRTHLIFFRIAVRWISQDPGAGDNKYEDKKHAHDSRALPHHSSPPMYRLVVNSALMIRRRKNIRPEASLDEILEACPDRLPSKLVEKGPNPEQLCSITELNALAEQQVRQLRSGLRAAYQLYDLDGLSASDSIHKLGIRSSAFKPRISRARRKVATGLQQSLQPPANGVSVPLV